MSVIDTMWKINSDHWKTVYRTEKVIANLISKKRLMVHLNFGTFKNYNEKLEKTLNNTK